MTNEDKNLLLKDLCARLPYHPRINVCNDSWEGCQIGEFDTNLYSHHIDAFVCDRIEVKPYLRPMSSMTEEEEEEYEMLQTYPGFKTNHTDLTDMFDWLLANDFDFRGLIPMGLALEAPKDMYKIE